VNVIPQHSFVSTPNCQRKIEELPEELSEIFVIPVFVWVTIESLGEKGEKRDVP
jgi:hypothetical protein